MPVYTAPFPFKFCALLVVVVCLAVAFCAPRHPLPLQAPATHHVVEGQR